MSPVVEFAEECMRKLAPELLACYVSELLLDTPRPFEDSIVDMRGMGGRRGSGANFGGGGGGGGGGRQEAAEWGSRRGGPPGGNYNQDPRGPRGGMAGPQGGMGRDGRRGGQDGGDNWKSRGPPPPPSPAGRSSTLHRTDNRYVAGATTSADPDEEKKQRQFKAILNKLTIDNFEKLSMQVGGVLRRGCGSSVCVEQHHAWRCWVEQRQLGTTRSK